MPSTKEHLFDNTLQTLSDATKAFNHPARLRILYLLKEHGGLNTEQLIARTPKDYYATRYHLSVLRQLKIIKLAKHDLTQQTVYRINSIRFDQLLDAMHSIVCNFEYRKAA